MADQFNQETLILRHIRDNKKVLIDKAFVALMGLPIKVDLFRKCYEISEHREPKDIFNWVCITFDKEIEKKGYGLALQIENKLSQEEYHQVIAKCQMIAHDMQQVGYQPPSDDGELLIHLWTMHNLYKNILISWPPSIADIYLDFSFATLLAKAHIRIGSEYAITERKEIPSRKSTKAKRVKAALWKSFVLAIYEHGEPIAPRTKLSKVIEILQRQFEQSRGDKEAKWGEIPVETDSKKGGMKTPQRDSIVGLLKDKGIRNRDFEKLNGHWFKKM